MHREIALADTPQKGCVPFAYNCASPWSGPIRLYRKLGRTPFAFILPKEKCFLITLQRKQLNLTPNVKNHPMKKSLLILSLVALLAFPFNVFSQSGFCGADDVRQADYQADSIGFVQKQAAFVAMVNHFRQQNPNPLYIASPPPSGMGLVSSGCMAVKFLIPVVVHVIHYPGDTSTNISDAQIHNAIDEMNKAYRNYAGNFLPAANTGIQF